jgi:hypothetical protein
MNVKKLALAAVAGAQRNAAMRTALRTAGLCGPPAVPHGDVTDLVDPGGRLLDDRAALQQVEPGQLLAACRRVQAAITSTDDRVVLHLAQPWEPLLATLAGSWSSIQSRAWPGRARPQHARLQRKRQRALYAESLGH